jgi:hypothetical protein
MADILFYKFWRAFIETDYFHVSKEETLTCRPPYNCTDEGYMHTDTLNSNVLLLMESLEVTRLGVRNSVLYHVCSFHAGHGSRAV